MGGPDDSFKNIIEQEGIHHLLSSDEQKVPLSSSKSKKICLLFSANWSRACKTFLPQLIQSYKTLKDELEIIFISFDRDETGFKEHMKNMPWLAIPFDVNLQKKLGNLYQINQIPFFLPLNTKSLANDIVGLINDYGADAFPFTEKRQEELKSLDEEKRQGKLDALFANGIEGNQKIFVSELVGKTIGLYFGAYWCPPCRDFTVQLTEAYHEIVKKNEEFEVVFVSNDRDIEEFEIGVTQMPWLSIPFNDKTREDLCRIFKVEWIPTLIILGPDGKTISRKGRELISLYGARVFPFTESKIMEVEESLKKKGDELGLGREITDRKHEHVLKLDMTKAFICDFCKKRGTFWAFSCDVCGYDLHPTCIEEETL